MKNIHKYILKKNSYIYVTVSNLLIVKNKNKNFIINLNEKNLNLLISKINIIYSTNYTVLIIIYNQLKISTALLFRKKIFNLLDKMFTKSMTGYLKELNIFGLTYNIYKKKILYLNLESCHFNSMKILYTNYILLCNKNNFIISGLNKKNIFFQIKNLKSFKKSDNYKKKGIILI